MDDAGRKGRIVTAPATGLILAAESPMGEDLALIFDRHSAEMHADTPPESIHMLPRTDLVAPNIDFFVLRQAGIPLGMGALKHDGQHGELKSMHILAEHRGNGLSRRLLAGLVDQARLRGLTRLSLETGAQPSFAAARGLYRKAGFVDCPPFGDYRADPNSTFMTLDL